MVGKTKDEKSRHASAVPSSMVPPATKRKIQNDSSVTENNHKAGSSSSLRSSSLVISRDIVHYCFDVLLSHLNRSKLPKSKNPKFTNDA